MARMIHIYEKPWGYQELQWVVVIEGFTYDETAVVYSLLRYHWSPFSISWRDISRNSPSLSIFGGYVHEVRSLLSYKQVIDNNGQILDSWFLGRI